VNRQLRAVFLEITRQLEEDEDGGMAVFSRVCRRRDVI
jgi:hypothetical protein